MVAVAVAVVVVVVEEEEEEEMYVLCVTYTLCGPKNCAGAG